MKPQAEAAAALVTALKRADPLVIGAAGRELLFRIKTGKIKAAEAEEVAQKLKILGWDHADPIPSAVGKTVSVARVPAFVTRRLPYVRARCRLCHETIDLTPFAQAPVEEVKKYATRLAHRYSSVLFHSDDGKSDCLGVLDVLGVVFRKP